MFLFLGDLFKAVEYLESFYNLTKGRLWQTDSGENLHSLSCEHLRRVYTTISDEVNFKLLLFGSEYQKKDGYRFVVLRMRVHCRLQ